MSVSRAAADHSLRMQPESERISFFRFVITHRNKVAMLVEISLCHCIHDIPRGGKRIGQLIKQASAIPDFINDPEGFIDNVFFVPLKAIVLNRRLHFFFNGADAVQVFKIIDYIENYRCAFPVCRQSSSDLLFVNNRRNRRT